MGGKTNETAELPRLLASLDIHGRVISADALHTQRETARDLFDDKHANCFLTVKDRKHSSTL